MSFLGLFGLSASADRDPTSGFWYGPAGRKTLAGVDINETTAMNLSSVWAATRLLCATGSSLPLNVLRTTGYKTKEIATEHSTHRVLHHEFNPEMGSMMARSFGINMQVNWGNFYAEIVRERGDRGPVKELWPIHSSRVNPCRFDGGALGYRVRNSDGTTDDFMARDMFHVPSMISTDGICGKGVIQNARESLGAGIATERHGASYFANGAMPGIIIKGGKFKDKEDRADYRRQWMEIHSGPENALKPALLPEGADVSFMTFNARDSQFLELREHNVNDVARWYGVPPHMIYDLRRATFTNIEAQGIEFVVYSLVPWLKLWEEEIWRKLLTPQEQKTYFAKHAVEGLLRGDSAARAAFYTSLFGIGVLSINDILELEDRNPIGDEGDKHFVPLNMTTAEKAGEEEPQQAAIPSMPMEDEEPDDATEELAAYLQPPPQIVATPDNAALVEGCRGLLADTLGRMLNKECRACRAAAENNRTPKDFFAWLDDYYERYTATLTDAVSKQVALLLVAAGDEREASAVTTEAIAAHIADSKESILQATEVAKEQWALVPDRITACGLKWQAERTTLKGV